MFRERARSELWKRTGYPFVEDATRIGREGSRGRALLVYLVEPFLIKESDQRFFDHQNLRQCTQIAAALGDAGFCVDVADVHDRRFMPSREYDLVISHRTDLGDERGMLRKAFRVYLATGMSHTAYNRNIQARYQAIIRRRGHAPDAPIPQSESVPFIETVHAMAGFGNSATVGTWEEIRRVPLYRFDNYGFPSTRFMASKDYAQAGRHFLFFAGRGQLGKGLDLLLEIFSRHPDLHLHVCSAFAHEKSFVRFYERELYRTPNIHPVGLVEVNSDRFYDLAARCGFVILPSCSEGQPGSVVQGMHTGLIPLVTRECGLDPGDTGLVFRDDRIETVEESILWAAHQPADWLKKQCFSSRELSLARFSEEAFVRRWKEIAGEFAARSTGVTPP